jgi:hypothetical protein
MLRIRGQNSDPSNLYTVSTLSITQVDLYPNTTFDFSVNPENLSNTEAQLAGFSGVTWTPYLTTGQVESGILEATAITGTVDDYNPTGWNEGSYEHIVIPVTGLGATITGLGGGRHGRLATIINGTASLLGINLAHQSNGSQALNRFILSGLGPLGISAGGSARLVYHGGSVNRWRLC